MFENFLVWCFITLLPTLIDCKSDRRSCVLFSNTEIWFQSFFGIFSLIFKKKKDVIEQLYHLAMTSITQPVTTEGIIFVGHM